MQSILILSSFVHLCPCLAFLVLNRYFDISVNSMTVWSVLKLPKIEWPSTFNTTLKQKNEQKRLTLCVHKAGFLLSFFVIGWNGIRLCFGWQQTSCSHRQGFCAFHGLLLWRNIFGIFFRISFMLASGSYAFLDTIRCPLGKIVNEHSCRVHLERNINLRILHTAYCTNGKKQPLNGHTNLAKSSKRSLLKFY